MTTIASLANMASLIGEPARAAMLVTLMDGRALTAGELARAAGVTAPTASAHLARLEDAALVTAQRQGRHRYVRLASSAVAEALEALMALDARLRPSPRPITTGPRDRALRRARLCYDHLAGEVAVALTASMARRGQLQLTDQGAALTPTGLALMAEVGITLPHSAALCRPCLDWSERKPHIGGALGAAIFRGFEEQGWTRRQAGSRAVTLTRPGEHALFRHFGWRSA